MITKLQAPISVIAFYNHKNRTFGPKILYWDGIKHKVNKIGYHHTYYEGKNLIHVYSVLAKETFFKLKCDTQTMFWELEEISDGQAE